MVAPSLVTPSYDLLYLKRAALLCLTSFTPGSGSAWIESGQALLLYLDDVCEGSPDWHARLFNFHWSWPWCQGILPLLGWLLLCTSWQLWATRYRIIGSMAFYELLKMLWEPGFWAMHQVVRAYTCFTCLTFIDWSAFVGLGLVVGAVLFVLLLLSFCPLTNLCDRVVNRWPV